MSRIVDVLGELTSGKRTLYTLYAMTAIALPAQTFTTLDRFDDTNGTTPVVGLVQATNGYLYGTTSGGGAGTCGRVACGTIFKMTPGADDRSQL